MATVINNPPAAESDSAGVNWVMALVVIIALFFLLFYGLPFLRSGGGTQVQVPSGGSQPQQQNPQSGSESSIDVDVPAVNVPEEVNINTNPNPNQ